MDAIQGGVLGLWKAVWPRQPEVSPLRDVAKRILSDMTTESHPNLERVIEHARLLGVTDAELRTIAMQSTNVSLTRVTKQLIGINFHERKEELRQRIINCSEILTQCTRQYVFHQIWTEFLITFNKSEFVLEVIDQMTHIDKKAILLLLMEAYGIQVYPRLQLLFPKCSYEVQKIIHTRINRIKDKVELYKWFQIALLKSILKQPHFTICDLFDLFAESPPDFINQPKHRDFFLEQRDLFIRIINTFTNWTPDTTSVNFNEGYIRGIIRSGFVRLIGDPELIESTWKAFSFNLITSLSQHTHQLSYEILRNIYRTTDFLAATIQDPQLLILQTIKNDLIVNLTLPGEVTFRPLIGMKEIQQQTWSLLFVNKIFYNSQTKFAQEKSSALVLIEAPIGKFENEMTDQSSFLALAKTIYLNSSAKDRSAIRLQILKFYIHATRSNEFIQQQLGRQIIKDFEMTVNESMEFSICLLDEIASDEQLMGLHDTMHKTVRTILNFSTLIDPSVRVSITSSNIFLTRSYLIG